MSESWPDLPDDPPPDLTPEQRRLIPAHDRQGKVIPGNGVLPIQEFALLLP